MTKETCQHRRNGRLTRHSEDARPSGDRSVAAYDDNSEEEEEVVTTPHNAKGDGEREAGDYQQTSASSSTITSIQEDDSSDEEYILHKPEAAATTPIERLEVAPLKVPASFLGELRKAIREEVTEAIQKSQVPESVVFTPADKLYFPPPPSTLSSDSAVAAIVKASTSPTTIPAPIPVPKPGVRFSDRRTFAKRPAASRRISSGISGISGISAASDPEQHLFDDSGCATARSVKFLRELAKYVTVEFGHKGSLVVTPEKLAAFYARYDVEGGEVLPFIEIFSSKTTTRDKDAQQAHHERIADLFSDLGCAYHLTPPPDPPAGASAPFSSSSRPQIPGLTPSGFCRYFTTCLLAYPDEEFRRLEKIVADVASSPSPRFHPYPHLDSDGGSGGMVVVDCMLPRPFIRSLLPARHDPIARRSLTTAFEGLVRDPKKKPSSPPPSPSPAPAATTMPPPRMSPVPAVAATASSSSALSNSSSPAVVSSHHPAEKRGIFNTETVMSSPSSSSRRYVPEATTTIAQHMFDSGGGGGNDSGAGDSGGESGRRRSTGQYSHPRTVVPATASDRDIRHKESESYDQQQRGAAPTQYQQKGGVAHQAPSGLPSLRGGKKPSTPATPAPEAFDYNNSRGRGHGHESDYFSGHHHHNHHHHHHHSHDHDHDHDHDHSSRRYHPDHQPPFPPHQHQHQRQHRRQYSSSSSGHMITTPATDPYPTPSSERTNPATPALLPPPHPTTNTSSKFKSTPVATPNPGAGPGTPGLIGANATGTISRSYSVSHVPPPPSHLPPPPHAPLLPPHPPAVPPVSSTTIPITATTAATVSPTVIGGGTPLPPPPPIGPFATATPSPAPLPPSHAQSPTTTSSALPPPLPPPPPPPPSAATARRQQSFLGQQQQQQQQARGAPPQATIMAPQERYGGGGGGGGASSSNNNNGHHSSSSRSASAVVDRGPTWDEVLGAQKSAAGMGMGLRRRDTVPAQLS